MTIITPTLKNVKTCSKCKEQSPLSQFSKNKQTKDGYRSCCNKCDRAMRLRWLESAKGKANQKKWRRIMYASYPERAKARGFVSMAVHRGTIPPATELDCEHCAAPAKEYHHTSYLKEHWLTVIPLCKPCHTAIHRKTETAASLNLPANTPCTPASATEDN